MNPRGSGSLTSAAAVQVQQPGCDHAAAPLRRDVAEIQVVLVIRRDNGLQSISTSIAGLHGSTAYADLRRKPP